MPLKEFARTAREIALGDLSKRIDETRADEIGELGHAFNRMADNLQALYQSLENRVDERTRELKVSNDQLQDEIIERKQVERALRESRQLLEAIVEHIPVMVFVKRASDLRFELFNRAGENLLGYSRSDLLGKGDCDFLPKEQGDWFTAADRKALASVEVSEIPEEPIMTARGEARYLHTWKVALRDESGEPAHLLGISIDITERKQAEELLKRHKQILDITSDGFWMVDAKGNLLEANQAYANISGYSVEELVHMHISQLEAVEKSVEEVKAHIDKIVAQGFDQFETRHRHKYGHEIDIEVNTVYMRETQQFAAFLRDITKRKRIEKELKSSRDQYDRLTTNIPIGVYLLRTTAAGEFFFKYVSARFCAMLGVTAESIYADSAVAFQAIHPNDLTDFIKLNQVAVQTRKPFQWEGRTLVNGATRWFRIESKPEPLDNGDCIWDGVMADITERKLAQIELQRNQDLLNEAQRLGQLGSWELDLVSGKLRWSDEIYRIFELDPAQFTPSYENFLNYQS